MNKFYTVDTKSSDIPLLYKYESESPHIAETVVYLWDSEEGEWWKQQVLLESIEDFYNDIWDFGEKEIPESELDMYKVLIDDCVCQA